MNQTYLQLYADFIVKVGINFDEERRTIGDWEVIY